MRRYSNEEILAAELADVIEKHVGGIMTEATSDDDVEDFELPMVTAFVCGIEISDAAHSQGRWYIHRTGTTRISPVHANGILHELLNNWNLAEGA